MDLFTDLAGDIAAGLAYCGVGLVLLAVGFFVIDVLIPGDLADLIYRERNFNAAVTVASGLVAIGTIVVVAILTSEDSLGEGLASTAAFGVLGILLLAIAFKLVDLVTPGELGEICSDPEHQPAVWVTVATQLALGAVVAAAIS